MKVTRGKMKYKRNLVTFLKNQELGKQWWLLVGETYIHLILYILCW